MPWKKKTDSSEEKALKKKTLRKAAPAAPVKEDEQVAEPMKEAKPKEEWTIHRIDHDAFLYSEETNQKILDYLIKLGLITGDQVKKVLDVMRKNDADLIEVILQTKLLKENDLGQAIAAYFNCTYTRFTGNLSPELLSIIPKAVIQKAGAVVFGEDEGQMKVAMVNPEDFHFIHLLEKKIGKKIEIHYTTPNQIEGALKAYPSEFEDKFQSLMLRASDNISRLASLDNISQVFDSLVLMAYQRGASDVHIEPLRDDIRVRFRIDGVLHSVADLPGDYLETIVNHIKVLAKLRIDTHNAAQDGRFHVTYDKTLINFRVSVMPTHYGEKVVLRLLTSETQEWSLEELGYLEKEKSLIEKNISKTNGMILVCGPTGSGKTTTLYAILKELNEEGVNISTIEDPIEYGLPGIMQIQVNKKTNITYAEGLKSLMRQDPDILMIGEIRDHETGDIAVNASLTGHLVLSTLHTNNASLAPLRMLQMGIDPYLIVTTVQLIVAQRLVRKLCTDCMISYSLKREEIEEVKKKFGLSSDQSDIFDRLLADRSGSPRLFKGKGCKKCGDTGFYGRTVIAEVFQMKDNIRELIIKNASESEIQKAAEDNGMVTMLEDGLRKVLSGSTTLEEVMRVINQ